MAFSFEEIKRAWFSQATQGEGEVQAKAQAMEMIQVKTKFDANTGPSKIIPMTRGNLDPVFLLAKHNHVW